LDTWIIMLALLKTLRKEIPPDTDLEIVGKSQKINFSKNINALLDT